MHDNENFHWLYGIEELFKTQTQENKETLKSIIEVLLRGDITHMQRILPKLESLSVDRQELCLKVLTEYWNENIDNHELVEMITILTKDPFIIAVNQWYKQSTLSINLNDHFGRGQIKSKLWLIEILSKTIANGKLGTIALYGGWYGTINWFLNEYFTVQNTINFELDPLCVTQSELFNQDFNFKAIESDVSVLAWDENKLVIDDQPKKINVVINTSCEHMNDNWYYNLPTGQFVVLQTNDFFECSQHTNCVASLEEAEYKYPMQQLVYSGELATNKYNRFMLIGLK